MVANRVVLAAALAVMGAAIMVSPAAAQEAPKAMPGVTAQVQMAPGIVGTWMLMSRDLPDGTQQMPPAVSGLLSYTAKYRNFNVMWKDAAGKKVTISYAAEYKLTATEYSETPMVWVMTNEAGPERVSYTWPADKTRAQPVTMEDGQITFAVSGELPTLTFEGDKMTAVAEGQFTDHWQRVSGK